MARHPAALPAPQFPPDRDAALCRPTAEHPDDGGLHPCVGSRIVNDYIRNESSCQVRSGSCQKPGIPLSVEIPRALQMCGHSRQWPSTRRMLPSLWYPSFATPLLSWMKSLKTSVYSRQQISNERHRGHRRSRIVTRRPVGTNTSRPRNLRRVSPFLPDQLLADRPADLAARCFREAAQHPRAAAVLRP